MSLCFWVLPGKVHRRRLPLPQTNLGSVQTGFPRRPGPEPKHTSASGTAARNNIMFLHPRFQKSYSWAAWFCHSLNVEWCSHLWRGNLKKPLTIFEAECFLKPDVAKEHTDKHLMAGPPLLLARHSPGCYPRPSWWKASGDRSCQAEREDLSSLVALVVTEAQTQVPKEFGWTMEQDFFRWRKWGLHNSLPEPHWLCLPGDLHGQDLKQQPVWELCFTLTFILVRKLVLLLL